MPAPDIVELAGVAAGTVLRRMVPYGVLADGSPAAFPLIVVAGADPGPTAMLTGGIHGDEFEGPSALWRLVETLDPMRLAGRVVIVPVANLPAFAAGTRTSPVDGQNLARIFPGDPGGTLSFRLAHALFGLVRQADFLVDCHSGGVRLEFMPVAGFYGPSLGVERATSEASIALARDLALSHLWRLPPRSGVLSFEAMRIGVPATGGEIRGRGGLLQAEADGYFDGIRRILARRGMLPDIAVGETPDIETVLQGDWALAPVGGFIDNHVTPGERVTRGTRLASIRGPLGEILAELEAERDGIVMGVRHLRSIQPGEWATCVVEEVTL